MDKQGTDFLDDMVGRTTRPRFNRWGSEIVIDGNGQVRFHQKVLHTLGELPTEPRVLVVSPDEILPRRYSDMKKTRKHPWRTTLSNLAKPRSLMFFMILIMLCVFLFRDLILILIKGF